MAIKTINAYLFFDGSAAAAIAFYEKALDAKVVRIMRYSDMPGGETPPGQADGVMHAQLEAGGGTILISDARPGDALHAGRRGGPGLPALKRDEPTSIGTSPHCPRAVPSRSRSRTPSGAPASAWPSTGSAPTGCSMRP